MRDDIGRFLEAQEEMYGIALEELMEGRKRSHWIWYIFPQLKGLGRSYNADCYGISGLEEAKEYLKNPILRNRLFELCEILLQSSHADATLIFGDLDAMKLRSSMTLFDAVEPDSIFDKVITKFFDGQRCHRTLQILN